MQKTSPYYRALICRHLSFLDLLSLMSLVLYVFFTGPTIYDPGLGWHLQTGKLISEQAGIIQSGIMNCDPFSWTAGSLVKDGVFVYTENTSRWLPDQWLADWLFYNLYDVGGVWLLSLCCLFLGCYSILLWGVYTTYELPVKPIVTLLTIFLSYMICSIQWIVRPVVFSFFFFGLTVFVAQRILSRYGNSNCGDSRYGGNTSAANYRHDIAKIPPSYYLLLTLIFAIWGNLHPAFPMGIGVLCFLACDLCYTILFADNKNLISNNPDYQNSDNNTLSTFLSHLQNKEVITALAKVVLLVICPLIGTLITPFGWHLHLQIFDLLSNSYFMKLNLEWLPPGLFDYPAIPLALVIIMAGALSSMHIGIFHFLLVTVFTYLAFSANRYIPFWGLAIIPQLAISIAALQQRIVSMQRVEQDLSGSELSLICSDRSLARPPFLSLIFWVIGVVFASWSNYPLPVELSEHILAPAKYEPLVNFVKHLPPNTRFFHTPDWGGVIIRNTYPAQLVWLDDRNQIHPPERYEDYFHIAKAHQGWEEIVKKYNFEYLLLQAKDPLVAILATHAEWRSIYTDSNLVFYEKSTRQRDSMQVQHFLY